MSDHEAKAREILEKIDSDRLRSDIHPAQARDEHIGAIANALAEATERAIAKEREFHPYMRIVDAFDKDDTAAEFLREDGDGGFAGGVYRMAREIDKARGKIGELERELGRDDEDLPDVKPMSKEAYEECMRLASDYEDRRAFEVPAVAARIAELEAELREVQSKSYNQYKCGFAHGCHQFRYGMAEAGHAEVANTISADLIERYARDASENFHAKNARITELTEFYDAVIANVGSGETPYGYFAVQHDHGCPHEQGELEGVACTCGGDKLLTRMRKAYAVLRTARTVLEGKSNG